MADARIFPNLHDVFGAVMSGRVRARLRAIDRNHAATEQGCDVVRASPGRAGKKLIACAIDCHEVRSKLMRGIEGMSIHDEQRSIPGGVEAHEMMRDGAYGAVEMPGP